MHSTKNRKYNENYKTKPSCSEEMVRVIVRGGSLEGRSEAMVGRTCENGRRASLLSGSQ